MWRESDEKDLTTGLAIARRLGLGVMVLAVVLQSDLALSTEYAPSAQLAQPPSTITLKGFSRTEEMPAPWPPLSATALTLDQAVNLCLVNDPKIRAGLEGIRQSHADAWTASLRPNPELSVGAGLLPLGKPFTEESPGGPPEFDLGVSYPIDWYLFGKRAAAMASAAVGVSVTEADYADLIRLRVTETTLAFYDVLEARDLLEVARQDVKNLERIEAITAKAVANGGRARVELSRIRLDLLNVRRVQRDAEYAIVSAKARLRALLGGSLPDAALDVVGTLDGPLTAEPLPPDGAYIVATQNRPDVLALRRKVAKARADIEVERRAALPEITSDFGYARQYQRSIGANDVSAWGTGLAVSVPLFDRNQGNRAKAASLTAQSNYELRTALLELRSEIEQAVESLHTAKENAGSVAQEELRLAAEVRDSINQAYEAGGRPLIDVLDAQRNYRDTYRIYISSRANYWRALCNYNSALGKQATR
ncbi:MAG TPA: TolC family protein [Thermoguttaceae bacterium]|nr:TolC family protein [Thermoguttaceae bacterium]